MKLYQLILVLFVMFVADIATYAQRYQAEICDSVNMETFTYATTDGEELKLDVYTPANEFVDSKVVILYIHGGGFSVGDRSSDAYFCKHLARYGFAAVSMSYRLTRKGTSTGFGCNCPASEKMATFKAAVDDVQAATAFLVQNYERLGIDPHRIILSGSSAGAETALNAAYQAPFCYGLETGPVAYAGVISMAGAIPDLTNVYEDSAVPSLFFHGTCDNLVPYASASHHYCKSNQPGYIMLHGGYSIAEKLRELGKPYWLVTICGGNHEWAGKPMKTHFDEMIQFCNEYVIEGKMEQRHTIIPGDHSCSYPSFNFCNQ